MQREDAQYQPKYATDPGLGGDSSCLGRVGLFHGAKNRVQGISKELTLVEKKRAVHGPSFKTNK